MKRFIWVLLVIALALLAVFFLMPQKLHLPTSPSGENTVPPPEAGVSGEQQTGSIPSQPGSDATPSAVSKTDPNLGTVEDQKKVVSQLGMVLQRNDLKPEERKQIEAIMADLQKRIGNQ